MGLSTQHRQAVPGAGSEFRTTCWSLILAAHQRDEPGARAALEWLCVSYWYPLYAFVRRQGHPPHEAEDLTQGFFTRLLETDFLTRVKPERGLFRSFLLAALKHFLANEWDARQAEKRGGGYTLISLDGEPPETRYALEPADTATPETLFEQRWAWTALERVLDRLRQEHIAAQKSDLFEELKPFLSEKKAAARKAIAARLGISVGAVDVAIHRLRQRYGELLREEIASTVSTPEEIENEIRHLIAMVRR
jgi:DNA-directed RNA polymerase specialized sigma24 family protein